MEMLLKHKRIPYIFNNLKLLLLPRLVRSHPAACKKTKIQNKVPKQKTKQNTGEQLKSDPG